MAFRVTTNGMFYAYTASLNKANTKLQKSMNGVATHREFSSYADDPAAASKAFQLRRTMWRTQDQIDNSSYLIDKFETGYNALDVIVDGDLENPGLSGIEEALAGMNATAGSSRRSLGQDLISKANAIAFDMNIRFSDEYVFAGADGLTPPFEWHGDTLTYRGVDVNAQPGSADFEKLGQMAEEETYVDIGLGMQEDTDGNVVDSSAFNSTLSGIKFLNYGVDEDGDPKNLSVLLHQLGNLFLNTSENGEFTNSNDEETALRLTGKLFSAIAYTQEQHVAMSANSNYLHTNMKHLSDIKETLNEEVDNLEQRDPADAIMEMYWAQYCYQASLKVGTDLLSQSLIDYMN